MADGASDILPQTSGTPGAGGAGAARGVLSRERFGALFEAASRTLWCIAAAVTGNRSKAPDIVQEAAVIALSKLGEFDPETSFTAWMGQIVRFVALNEGRRTVRERASLNRVSSMSEGASAPAASIAPGRFDARVESALSQLEETPRACLLLRTVMDLSYKEIAAALQIPEGTAMSHVFRARKAMRDRLGAEEEPAPAGAGGSP